jgi:hypothetical protein
MTYSVGNILTVIINADLFEMDNKCLVTPAQCFRSYQLASPSSPQQIVSNLIITVIKTYRNATLKQNPIAVSGKDLQQMRWGKLELSRISSKV